MNDDGPTLTVDEFVDYCRTQAGLLSGRVETMGAEFDDLLDEVDEGMAEMRARLEDQPDRVSETEAPSSADSPDGEVDVAAMEELEADLEEKQALAEAKQARMRLHQELAADYADLAEALQSDADDGETAMRRVVRFEAEHDAPAYFPDRQTVYEAATGSDDSGE